MSQNKMIALLLAAALASCGKQASDPRAERRIEELSADVQQLKSDVHRLKEDVEINHKFSQAVALEQKQ